MNATIKEFLAARVGSAPVIAIDMQEVFRAPESQWHVPGYDSAAQRVTALTEHFGDRVIWTKFVRDPEEKGSWEHYYGRWNECRQDPDSAAWNLTLPVADNHRVVSLPTFSKWGEALAEMTAESEVLVVCGVATDCCVISTVLGAVDAGKSVILVEDACAGITQEAHDQAIALMDLLTPMVTIMSAEELLSM